MLTASSKQRKLIREGEICKWRWQSEWGEESGSEIANGPCTVPSVYVASYLLAGEHWAGGILQNATSQPIFWGSEWLLRALEKCKRLACMWFLLTWGVLGRLHTLHGNGAELRSAANRHEICFPWYSAFSSMEALSLAHAFVTIITRWVH